jgi:hypothetical protein
MDNLDVDNLLNALDNEENSSLINLTKEKIAKDKNDILQQLQLDGQVVKELNKKLKCYRYIDELNDLKYGSYIRWINISNPDKIKLTNGGIVCDIKINDDGTHVVCKNSFHRFMQFKMDECIVFQKINHQEEVIIAVLSYLDK